MNTSVKLGERKGEQIKDLTGKGTQI